MGLSVCEIEFSNFRSYDNFRLSDIGSLMVLMGPNAIGKTNVIEGLQLLTALSSFRHATTEQLIHEGRKSAQLSAALRDKSRSLDISLTISEGKKNYFLNEKPKRPSDLKGLIPAVVFTPDDLELVKGSSTPRRTWIDSLGGQLSANYYVIKRDYEKVVRHKNRLLKEEASTDLIASINDMLITCGAQLACYRASLFERLSPLIQAYYQTISDGREELRACYIPSWEPNESGEQSTYTFNKQEARLALEKALYEKKYEETIRRRSLIGPHADHINFYINGKDASHYGSQGQQRSIVLALKIAEVSLIQSMLQQTPLLLLDDVMSELDASRRDSLISFIEGDIQTFITTTNLDYFDKKLINRADIVSLPLKPFQRVSCSQETNKEEKENL